MADATVTLRADDQISAPVLKAVADMQQMQAALNDIVTASKTTTSASSGAAAATEAVGAASEHSAGSHRAAHQALNLVTGSLVQVTGGSAAAEAGVRVLDSVMFQMAMTGGAISLGFVAIVVAAAAVGSAMRGAAEETKKQKEEMDKLTDSTTKAVAQLNYLDSIQKSVAGVSAANLSARMSELKSKIAETTAAMRENVEAAKAGQATTFMGAARAMAADIVSGGGVGAGRAQAGSESAAAQVKMASNLRILQEELKKTQHEFDSLTIKSSAYKSQVSNISDPMIEAGRAFEFAASQAESVGRALGDVEVSYGSLANAAQNSGRSIVEMATLASQQTKMMDAAIITSASEMGAALGNAIAGAKMSWVAGLKSIVDTFLTAVQGIIIAAMAANKAVSAIFTGPIGLGVGLASLAVVGAAKAAFDTALSNISAGSSSSALPAASAAASGGVAAGATSTSGRGGTAVSSAQKEIVNNISINMGVQALDLSAISDMQLKSLANKVGRLLSEAASTGQFSLVGA